MCRHPLTADVLLNIGRVAEVAPFRRQFGTQARIPWKMIGHGVDVKEKRPIAAFTRDDFERPVEVVTVSLEVTRAEVKHIQIVLDADGRLEGT